MSGKVPFAQDGPRDATPACSTQNYRWAFAAQSAEGQAKLAILLTAYALHKKLFVSGTGTCGEWPDTETVSYFILIDS